MVCLTVVIAMNNVCVTVLRVNIPCRVEMVGGALPPTGLKVKGDGAKNIFLEIVIDKWCYSLHVLVTRYSGLREEGVEMEAIERS
jgi:hypothetical protein